MTLRAKFGTLSQLRVFFYKQRDLTNFLSAVADPDLELSGEGEERFVLLTLPAFLLFFCNQTKPGAGVGGPPGPATGQWPNSVIAVYQSSFSYFNHLIGVGLL